MTTTRLRLSQIRPSSQSPTRPLGVDRTVELEIDGTRQRLRLCAAREGLPPVLVVQAGPGLPLLNEVPKFQRRLKLEQNFQVAYWEQRGCGSASSRNRQGLTLSTQVEDLCFVLHWLAAETGQKVVVLGISLGATVALLAANRAAHCIKSLVLVSVDTDAVASDSATHSFLRHQAAKPENEKMAARYAKLGAPPYLTSAPFQLRARLLIDLGVVEQGARFGPLLREMLSSLIRAYGWLGAARALRNMNAIQAAMLPELATLDLFARWPQPAPPVHYVFGKNDPLAPPALVRKVLGTLHHEDSLATLADAGHMAHFDDPVTIRALIAQAHAAD